MGPRVCSLTNHMDVGGMTITDFPTIPLQLLYLWRVFDVVFGIVIVLHVADSELMFLGEFTESVVPDLSANVVV